MTGTQKPIKNPKTSGSLPKIPEHRMLQKLSWSQFPGGGPGNRPNRPFLGSFLGGVPPSYLYGHFLAHFSSKHGIFWSKSSHFWRFTPIFLSGGWFTRPLHPFFALFPLVYIYRKGAQNPPPGQPNPTWTSLLRTRASLRRVQPTKPWVHCIAHKQTNKKI